jgi:(E)-2-((N-methylformamido)methylene)succinate hydrolase
MSEAFADFARKKIGDTAYIDVGKGEALVFVHGVGLNADAWSPQIAEFARTHRVIAVDMLGHGKSMLTADVSGIECYVDQLSILLMQLDVRAASVIGHSMGGLVAIGFALAHPNRTLRLGVLNSVYQRSAESRAAVEQRAREISQSGTVGNIEAPLERWFGEVGSRPTIAQHVARWLSAADPLSYAAAYEVFATSDTAYVGKLETLTMPSLFATGSDDSNSTAEMAVRMAEAAGSKVEIIAAARHMMNLTHVSEVNAALRDLLASKVSKRFAKSQSDLHTIGAL